MEEERARCVREALCYRSIGTRLLCRREAGANRGVKLCRITHVESPSAGGRGPQSGGYPPRAAPSLRRFFFFKFFSAMSLGLSP